MQYEWVIGRWQGDEAKLIKAHADAGIGYIVRSEEGRGGSYEIEAAFRRAIDSALPEQLLRATLSQSKTLDDKYYKRQGVPGNR